MFSKKVRLKNTRYRTKVKQNLTLYDVGRLVKNIGLVIKIGVKIFRPIGAPSDRRVIGFRMHETPALAEPPSFNHRK